MLKHFNPIARESKIAPESIFPSTDRLLGNWKKSCSHTRRRCLRRKIIPLSILILMNGSIWIVPISVKPRSRTICVSSIITSNRICLKSGFRTSIPMTLRLLSLIQLRLAHRSITRPICYWNECLPTHFATETFPRIRVPSCTMEEKNLLKRWLSLMSRPRLFWRR